MSTRNRIPLSLEAYLQLPLEPSLILLTGTLECSPIWLTARFVGQYLDSKRQNAPANGANEETAMVFVSWMRDLTFWKNEVRRACGIDISKLVQQHRFTFVDQLSLNSSNPSTGIVEVENAITTAISSAGSSGENVNLVLDQPDLLLATASTTTHELNDLILKLRAEVHSTILICSADLPLVSAARNSAMELRTLPVEIDTAAFTTQQAHNAHFIMSVRELGTGAARDVSGVLRVTRGGAAYDVERDDAKKEVKGMEALYLVQRDGSVKVFQRGEDNA